MALCQLEHCIADISCRMSQNGLKLNHEKTEWIIFNGNTNLIKDVELHIGTQTRQQSKVIKKNISRRHEISLRIQCCNKKCQNRKKKNELFFQNIFNKIAIFLKKIQIFRKYKFYFQILEVLPVILTTYLPVYV